MTIELSLRKARLAAAEPFLQQLVQDRFATRVFEQDASLWGIEASDEAAIRLGWTHPFTEADRLSREVLELRGRLQDRSIDRVILCGMGGSSLGPEVLARGSGAQLLVLDSTHPDEMKQALAGDLASTVVVISSKSGSTVETVSHAAIFEHAYKGAGLDPAEHILFVTDPGSPFDARRSDGFRVFYADPKVGGRFSVLTAFGVVPATLAGADVRRVLEEARASVSLLREDSADNPALLLAAAIASSAPELFALLLSEPEGSSYGLGDWIEQLVAESTGKRGKGILPIPLPPHAPELTRPPHSSLLVQLGYGPADSVSDAADISVTAPLGSQFLLWQVATAALGRLLGINPYDQPDVEAAKVAARSAMDAAGSTGSNLEPLTPDVIDELKLAAADSGYLAIQAFVDRGSSDAQDIRELRNNLAQALEIPVSLGWGPRYLHSTGQLHKGGPAIGVFLQIVDTTVEDLAIPGNPNGLRTLLLAQAQGDREVLEARGRPVLTRTLP